MNLIEVRKQNNHVLVQNEKYPLIVNCTDESVIPDIGVEYTYLQWGNAIWYEKFYVDMNNHVQQFTEEQIAFIEKICTEWVQPLGQEGNPTPEQIQERKNAENRAYLDSTDWVTPYIVLHKCGVELLPDDSNKLAIEAKRVEAIAFIRENEGK